MAVTSYKFAGTASTGYNAATDWSSPDNAKADDDTRTSCAIPKNSSSDILRLVNFGFTSADIPTDSTINGIELIVDRYANTTNVHDGILYLRKTSGAVGSNYASGTGWPGSESNAAYGGATDLWGTTWSTSDINADFGVDIAASSIGSAGNAYIDYIKIRIYYTRTYFDSGIRYYDGAVKSIAYETLTASHKLRFNKGGTIVGIPLVATTDPTASKIRIYDGSAVKSLALYT